MDLGQLDTPILVLSTINGCHRQENVLGLQEDLVDLVCSFEN